MASQRPNATNHPDGEELVRHQESLRQVIESISGELALRPLLTNIVRHACELLGADRGSIGLVDEDRELVRTEAVFRIAQEALNNVVKHAKASRVFVSLSTSETQCELKIEDDGCGFRHPESAGYSIPAEACFGLKNMQDRAEAQGGHFELTTSPGHGTRIEVYFTKPASTRDEHRKERDS